MSLGTCDAANRFVICCELCELEVWKKNRTHEADVMMTSFSVPGHRYSWGGATFERRNFKCVCVALGVAQKIKIKRCFNRQNHQNKKFTRLATTLT